MDEPTAERLALIQAKIRNDESISEDELRDLILAARDGKRSAAAIGQKASRSKKVVEIPSLTTLFQRKE